MCMSCKGAPIFFKIVRLWAISSMLQFESLGKSDGDTWNMMNQPWAINADMCIRGLWNWPNSFDFMISDLGMPNFA